MPRAFVRTVAEKRSPLVVIDLSERNTRAAVLQWEGEVFAVKDYIFLEAPGLLGTLTRPQLAEHFNKLASALSIKCREAVIVLGMHDAQVRTVELPNSPDTDFRTLLKLNTTKYFKADPAQLVVDCVPLAFANGLAGSRGVSKDAQVLGVALYDKLLRLVLAAGSDAGWKVLRVTPSQVGLANAVRLARPESVESEVMALVDFGPKTCAISALIKGQPAWSRIVELDESLSSGVDEAFATPYPVAAEIRTNLIRTRLQKLLFPIGRDISAAIDFFEAQANARITTVLFTGGTERAELLADTLQAQLDVPCQRLDPARVARISVPPGKNERAPRDLPRLAGGIGAAATHYVPELVQINFLAERLETVARRRRNPLRIGALAAAAAFVVMALWAGYTHHALAQTSAELLRLEVESHDVQATAAGAARVVLEGKKTLTTAAALDQHATNRFLFAPALNALQEVGSDEIHLVQLILQQTLHYTPPVKAGNKERVRVAAKKGFVSARVALLIQARNFGDAKKSDQFIDQIATQSYFQENLRNVNPVTLKSRTPRQVDPLDPTRVYNLFTIECSYPERVLGYE
jgi:Tfp pilus assembly PilM family ATPase